MSDTGRYVVFPLGGRRYALDSSRVSELLMPGMVYEFPHRTPSLEGVLVRRDTVIPVCDVRRAFGPGGRRRLYVVVKCQLQERPEIVAIPVCGDCQLVQGHAGEAAESVPFARQVVESGGEMLPLLNIDELVAFCIQPTADAATEAGP